MQWKWKGQETYGGRTSFQVGHSISNMHQSTVSELVLELLNNDRFAVVTARRLLLIKSDIFTCDNTFNIFTIVTSSSTLVM